MHTSYLLPREHVKICLLTWQTLYLPYKKKWTYMHAQHHLNLLILLQNHVRIGNRKKDHASASSFSTCSLPGRNKAPPHSINGKYLSVGWPEKDKKHPPVITFQPFFQGRRKASPLNKLNTPLSFPPPLSAACHTSCKITNIRNTWAYCIVQT